MQLRQVAFQAKNFNAPEGEPFSEFYKKEFLIGKDDDFTPYALALFALLKHLENNVDAPAQWICMSVGNLVLQNVDQCVYGEKMPANGQKTLWIAFHRDKGYKIVRYLPLESHPRTQMVIYASSTEEAGQVIAEALNTAPS